MVVSLSAALILVPILGGHPDGPGFWMSVVCPLAIAWPASAYQFTVNERLKTMKDRLAAAHVELDEMHRALTQAHAALQEKARHDAMTGALNRETFLSLLEAASTDRRACALLIIDADHFKQINDTYGHACGDEALKGIARTISSVLRPQDFWGRMGGEEFAVFLDLTSKSDAWKMADDIRMGCAGIDLRANGKAVSVSISIGAVCFTDGFDPTVALNETDRRLYRAKHAGRNCVVMDEITRRTAIA
ncbi:GGDEF domain-containing protein [Rhizobium sp. KVB221]|uniref:diguanylate cyclase n=1 Tax=Rhizobium setariae TaxID=2801340 RepID=A0A937CNF3_9HYPH|nr:GGDEF domain-containing protein [Rhizobium setariae]MBL0370612.1 GGDEF domain-containing protein [Rhizobium setariae]